MTESNTLREELEDLEQALPKLEAWERDANERGNRPLTDVLFRARLELQQRRGLVESIVDELEAAPSTN